MSVEAKTEIISWLDMPFHSRVWVYQSDKALNDDQVSALIRSGRDFVRSWASHGHEMKAVFEVFHHRFVVMMADEEQAKASGCSIDSSVRFMQDMERELHLNFFNRMVMVYKAGAELRQCLLSEIPSLIESGELTKQTVMFDNVVSDKTEFMSKWTVPMESTWTARYFNS